MEQLHLVAKYLLEHEKLDGGDFALLMEGKEEEVQAAFARREEERARKEAQQSVPKEPSHRPIPEGAFQVGLAQEMNRQAPPEEPIQPLSPEEQPPAVEPDPAIQEPEEENPPQE